MAALSARVGSIGDNRLGGWVGYRSAKAALNQIIRTLAIELAGPTRARSSSGFTPGRSTPACRRRSSATSRPDRLFTPQESATRLLAVLDGLTPADSGGCFDHAGERIAP